jgi:Na+/H+ antiporter NhaD/arsenite permease-like protein
LPAIALSPACGGSRAPHTVHIRAAAHPPASLRAAVVAANLLAAFLDNAPTYLVFFLLAGGDAAELMDKLAPTLAAISMGAVNMGALTYIGNAPNFMVYAIANERGVKMPSFFGYMLWSGAVLLPVLALLTFLFVGAP